MMAGQGQPDDGLLGGSVVNRTCPQIELCPHDGHMFAKRVDQD